MDDEPMQDRKRVDEELRRRLAAYAEARLSPDLSATTRMRAHVMTAAHRRAALAQADRDRALATSTLAPVALADRTRRPAWRRPLTALLAAGLTLGVGVGTVAAAQAGGPLYGARIWAETLTLPASANERAQAELHRLEDRLAEAAAASAAGNVAAANAALEAYAAIVNEATDDVGNDVAAAATLDAGVRSNIDVLTVLVGRVPDQAGDAIQRAIDRSNSALDALQGKPSDTPGGPPTTFPATTPNPGEPDRTSNPNKPTPDPSETPRVHPTPKPHPTTGAQSTRNPGRTPAGGQPAELPDAADGTGNPQER
jgi:hypothetical protein